ncbi:SprB repeat-containing protein, partial [Flavobacterium sp. ASV13]|uniref:SprB repeat-containing protein n=1 Tax=Flavobacterium sp. ASV13 TaxID=1506583 RepID=UPI000550BE56
MKKPTILKIAILLLLILQADVVFSQTYKAFNKEYTTQVRGDIINIGNSILNRGTKKSDGTYSVSPNTPFSGTTSNDTNGNFDMYYINVDPVSNNSTPIFSSSSATLTVPNNIAPAAPCYKVAYAALYWSGILRSPADRTKIKNVKIKVPNTTNSNYQDVVGTVIWDIDKNADGISDSGGNKTQAYACFAPITSLLNATNPNGVYTVANVLATEGVKNTNGSTGLAAGWSLFIIYEDNSLPTKSISTFNGFFGIGSNAGPISTTVNGFTTPDLGDVNARVAFSALEGDQNYSGDYLYINSKSITTSPSSVRPINNFFKSSITTSNGVFTDRNPNGTNTLGFDAGVLDITPQSGIIPNKATSAQITIGTNVDVYINYFLAFSVDVIAPNVKLIKKVHDAAEVDAENKNVTLGQELRYTLSFKNSGNDSATEFTITDQLPTNTNFNFPADIFKLPTGMTIANNVTYNAATRTITFKVPNSLVEKNDPEETIRFKVKVVDDCASLIDACNNVIRNSALTSYRGNPAAGGGGNGTLFGDTSYASANSCNATPQSTNFLVGLDACKNSKAEICLTDMELSAAGGYTTYKWATSTAYNPVLGTNQKLKITGPGTYYVYSTKTGCPDFEQIITVTDGGGVKTNPIIKYADNKDSNGVIAPCDIDGKPLPKIFLCGANDSRLFDLALPSATVVWEKTTCVRPPLSELSDLCADERASCTWVSAGPNGSLFTASEAGYYRVTISSGGCVNKFYFNVYKSDVAINETHKNILCTTPGSITVDKLTGYEFSLTHVLIPASSSTTTAWGDSNVFSITQEGNYVVNYRLKNVNPTCAYKTNQIIIAKDGFTVGIDNPNENPLCFGDKGRIQVSATSGFTGYYYTVYEDGVLYQDLGPLPNRTQDFKDLTPGKTYRIVVFTKKADGSIECTDEVSKLIPNPAAALTLTSSVIKPLTACADGQYRITASGGKFPYAFFVDGSATEYALDENGNTDLNSIILNTPTAKEYTILVRDFNRCETTYKFTVAANPKPVYTVVPSTINCYGEKGSITVNVTNANGYALEYSIDNGATFGSNPTFLNLKEGTYNVVVRYTLSGQTCTDPAQAVAILPPANALTASGGVSELAGCRLGGLGGRLRFTNVTGGTIPYEYSFDGGASWQTSPEKDVMDGTYVLIVRDSKGCTYKLPYDVILDPKPADPQIDPINVVYNCTGTGIATVTVNNPANGNYSYEYYLDDVPNTPIDNNVFTNVISGSHNIKVKYKLEDASTYSNLLKEDFGHGDPTTSPGIAAAYCFNDQRVTAPYVCGTQSVEDNQYSVASFFWRNDNAWYHFKDHTSNGAVADGRYLLVNIGSAAGDYGILYSKPIADVIPNQPVKVDLAVANLLNAGKGGAAPIVRFELVNPAGVVVARVDTGKIAEDPNDPNRTKWIEIPTISLNPGNNTNLTFVIRSGSLEYNGNDLLIDDISVYQLPKSCLQEQKILFDVGTDKAFTVLEPVIQDVACNGGNTGAITITAQNFGARFYYSINGGTLQSSTTSPVTISGLTAGNYSVVVQSDAAGTCSKSYSKTIGSPSAVTVTASVTTPLTCNPNSAAITAVAVGGTSPYKYELRAADGVTVITAFQDSAVFTGLGKGTYTVAAKDLRGCSSAVSTAVIINDAPPVTASLASSSDLCFDANKATIVVTASGTGTLSYSLDGAAAVTTNTFTNVGVGTHSVLVTDANNCTVTVSNIIVAPELKGKPQVTKTLDCNTAGATIKVDIEGGTAPFTYKYKLGASGTYSSSIPVTGTSFNYAAAGAGTYYFEISDANSPTSCKVEVSATVDAITNPTVTAQPVQVTCNGGSTGEVTLVASGGSGGYSYSFNNSGFTTTIKYTGLKAGIAYPFQVMDDKGCKSAIGSITLTEPTAVQGTINATELTCSSTGTVPAVVTVTGSGGTGPYQYSFNGTSNFTTTNTYSTSAAGTVTAYIKDSNNCQIGPLSITIATLYQITDITITDNGYDCSTTPPGGHVNIAAVKGGVSAPIRYQIISGPAGYDTATNSDGEFKSLAPGSYIFQATDIKTGCSFTKQYTVNGSPDIVTGGSILTTIKCFGGTGTIQFTVNGIKSRFDYVIKNGSGTIIQSANNLVGSTNTTITVGTALAAGAYTITATDRTTKCQSAYTVTLTQPANALDVTATVPNINCNNGQAIITAVGSGGTTSYTYAVVIKGAVPTAGAYGTDPKLSVNTVNGTKVDWDVYIKDANGCTDFVSVKVLQDQTPSVTATLDNQCTGSGNKFRITANGTGGIAPLTYGINGATGAFGPDNFFDVVASATPYIVWVKDANGCTAQAAAITVYPQLTATTAIKELDCSTTNPDATITVTPNGGKSPYTYQVSTNNGTSYSAMASNVYTTSTAGTFLIKVTDANGCTFVTTTPILSISNPTVTANQINVSCNGGADGSVQLIGAGGSLTGGQNYQYSKYGIIYGSASSFTGLAAGDYDFFVKDSKGCVGKITVTITEPSKLVVSASATKFTCSTTNTKQAAVVTIAVPTTGTSPYEYSFNGGGYAAGRTLTVNDNGTDQVINYSVKDAKGCTASGSLTLNKLNPPVIASVTPTAVTCLATSSSVTVTTTAGTGVAPLAYTIIAPASATSNVTGATSGVFTGLAPDTYTFKVTDANGCYDTKSVTVNPVTPIAIAGNKNNDAKCKGTSTGNGTFTISGIATVGNYSFTLTAGTLGTGTLTKSGNTLSLTNVAAGTYTVSVTDTATGCTNSTSITIGEPALALDVTALATNINCNNDNAVITATATGGTTNYSYAVVKQGASAPATTAYGTNNVLTVDTNSGADMNWVVYVMDANGCTDTVAVPLATDPTPSVTAVLSNQCTGTGSGFTITATGTGGTGTLQYGINGVNGAFSTSNVFNVAAGTYTVWVKDANNCPASATPITVNPQLTAIAKVTKQLDCTPTPNAAITVDITGGKSTYTYKVDPGTGTYGASIPVTGTQFVYTGAAAAGTYNFEITDSNNPTACKVIVSATVNAISNPTVTATQVNITCFGANNGSVVLTGSGGSGNYTYSDALAGTYSTTASFTGLTPGSHTFYVKDSKLCSGSVTVTILEPTALVVSATSTGFTCSTTNTKVAGSVTIAVPTTGTSPYEYSFNGGGYGSTRVLTVNDNGTDQTINYSVRDAKGCITNGSVVLNKLNSPKINTVVASAVTCLATSSTVTVTTTVGTGVGTLVYSIISPATATGNTTGATSGVFTGLAPDTYTFKVTDANGCYDTKSITVNPVTPIAVGVSKLSDVKCKGDTTGSARYTVTGFSSTGNYSVVVTTSPTGLPYTTSTSGDVITLTGMSNGNYTLAVVDNTTGCPANATITIAEPANALSATFATVNANCLVGTSKVTVTAAGGTIAYKYAFIHDGATLNASDFGPSNVAYLDPATTDWDVYVRDANNCQVKLDVTIAKDNAPTVTASAVGQCLGVGTYTITAVGTGTGTLQYSINGTSYQAGNTFTVTAAGTYNIWGKDANGCTAQTTVPVIVNDKLTLSAQLNKNITCVVGSEAAQITLTAGGGNGVYTYSFTSSAAAPTAVLSGNVLTTSDAGNYTFTVTDGRGCTFTTTVPVSITLPVYPEITGVTQTQFINCFGEETAAISIAVDNTKGVSPFVFNVRRTAPTVKDYGTQTSGLTAGDYTITVTDSKGCTDTETIHINEPLKIVVTSHAVNITCVPGVGTSKGSVIVDNVTGGTAPYTYYVTGINNYFASENNLSGTTSVTFDVVDFGLYQIRVVDAKGCTVVKSDVLVASPPSALDIQVDLSTVYCTAVGPIPAGGTAVVKIGSTYIGPLPFHFNIYRGATPPQIFTADGTDGWQGEDPAGSKQTTFTGLTPGVQYTFIVYDENTKCYYYQVAGDKIPTNTQLTVAATGHNITCTGAADGAVDFVVTNPYGSATPITIGYDVINAFNNLSTGITGTSPSTTSNFAMSNVGPLPKGTYYVLIKELVGPNAGCSVASANFNILESPQLLVLTASVIKKANCANNSGIITATASFGTAPYTYQLLPDTAVAPTSGTSGWNTPNTFNANAGDYVVYAKDAYNCIKAFPITLDKYTDPTINVPAAICYTGSPFTFTITGSVDPTIVGGATYSVDGSTFQSSPTFTFSAAKVYTLSIKDGNGCIASTPFEVKPQLKLDVKQTRDLSCIVGSEDAQFTLTATDGYGTYAYSYTYNGGTSTTMPSNVLTAGGVGTYVFTVTDAQNCQATYTINLDAIPTINFTVSSVDASCNLASDGTITAVVSAGVGPFKYQLEDGATIVAAYQDSNEFKNLPAKTTYVVRVKDARDCTDTKPATIGQPTPLTASSTITTALLCTAGNAPSKAVVTVTPSGGTSPYQYSYDNGTSFSGTNTYETFAGITFDVIVKDANGCTFTITNGV